jgi:release factor glutamine methyltransferase
VKGKNLTALSTSSSLEVSTRTPTVGQCLSNASAILTPRSESARLDAELLLGGVLRCDRSYLYAHPEASLSAEYIAQFEQLLKRRCQGEPLAYLLGYKEFWSLRLQVTQDVLVPRPETELLVELALASVAEKRTAKVVDLGTGCGAIGLAIAYERPQWRVTATDISRKALWVAVRNRDALKLRNIIFAQGSWFSPLRPQGFDLVVVNPPYVSILDPHLNQPELRHEPQMALVSPEHGLAAIKHIIINASGHLQPGGRLLLEHGHDQGKTVRALLKYHGFTAIKTHNDLADHERVSLGACRT